MRERPLKLKLDGAIDAYSGHKWKCFYVDDDAGIIRLETGSPFSNNEILLVELPYKNEHDRKQMEVTLEAADFFERGKIRTVHDF